MTRPPALAYLKPNLASCLAGGCVRLPRVIGADSAMEVILQGKACRADEALKKIGLLDTRL
ncbi:hypothetical protein OK016_09400 [Vibrio chagasii]|nr:hypothetical protein [Vibrio chagasii]